MNLTRHACQRSSQRSVPQRVVFAIYKYGTCRNSQGASSVTLDRYSLTLAKDDLPAVEHSDLARYMGVYLIIGDGERVVTVARSSRRCRH